MSFSLFSLAILSVFAVVAAVEIYQGMKKGVFRALVALVMAVAYLIASIILAPRLAEVVVDMVYKNLDLHSLYRSMRLDVAAADAIVPKVANILASIVLLVVIFLFLLLLRNFICFFALDDDDVEVIPEQKRKAVFFSKFYVWCNTNRRLLGGAVGALSAILITMVITSPFMGILDVGRRAIGLVNSFDEKIWERAAIDQAELEAVDRYAMDIPGNIFYRFGGKHMVQAVAKTQYRGQTVYFFEEMDTLEQTLGDLQNVLETMRGETYNSRYRVEKINALCADIENLTLSEIFVSDVVSQCAQGWMDGKKVMQISKPYVHPSFADTFDQMLMICESTPVLKSKQNSITLLRVYGILLENGFLEPISSNQYGTMLIRMERAEVVSALHKELSANPAMTHLQKRLPTFALRMLSKAIMEEQAGSGTHSTVVKNLANALTDISKAGYLSEDRMATALAPTLKECISDYEYIISNVTLQDISLKMVQELVTDNTEVTAQDVEYFLREYYK